MFLFALCWLVTDALCALVSAVARRLQSAIVSSRTPLSSVADVSQLFVFLAPVVKDIEGTPSEESDVRVSSHTRAALLPCVADPLRAFWDSSSSRMSSTSAPSSSC